MPLNPRRVQAVFLEAADCHDPVDPATILDRGCSADLELPRTAADPARRRVVPFTTQRLRHSHEHGCRACWR